MWRPYVFYVKEEGGPSRGMGEGELQFGEASSLGAVGQLEVASMQEGDFADEAEAKSGAFVSALGPGQGEEALKEAGLSKLCNAFALVFYADFERIFKNTQTNRNESVGG